MGLFDRWLKRPAAPENPALVRAVAAYRRTASPSTLLALYRALVKSTLLVPLAREVQGLASGAHITPKTGVRVEFLTARDVPAGVRAVIAVTDLPTLHGWSSGICPHVTMRALDLCAVLAESRGAISLIAGKDTMLLDATVVATLAAGKIPPV